MVQKKKYPVKYDPIKNCSLCGKRLRGKMTYSMGVCSECFNTKPEFKGLKNELQKKYWEENPDKYDQMKKKRLERYYKNPTKKA